ncbi:hypothetical protein GCM10015536_19160 [Streptomyces griseomycini]|nr:hypothetical protein GCM10015536_19160 [Streptomyces griseomycini]
MESESFSTFSENLCQPLPAEILPGRPVMLTSTLVSAHTDGSGSGDSVSSGADVLGAGLVAEEDVLGAGADSLVEELGLGSPVSSVDPVDSLADGEGDVSVVSSVVEDSVAEAVAEALDAGAGSVAYAAGAARRATGAITAVAAAAAMARRSFMKTSGSSVCRECGTGGRRLRAGRTGVVREFSVSSIDDVRGWLSWPSRNSYVRWVTPGGGDR